MALRRAIACTPTASVIVSTAGSPSGNRRDGEADHGHEQFGEGQVADEIAVGEQSGRDQQDQERQPAREDVHLRGPAAWSRSPPWTACR